MSTEVAKKEVKKDVKWLLSGDAAKRKFQEVLGKKANGFVTSVIQVASQPSFDNVDPNSVYAASMIAATLDLPINPNLGFAWIIPYKEKREGNDGQWRKVKVAQFQMGWKGFVQLALRTGQYENINAIPIDKAQFVSWNPLTEVLILNFDIPPSGEVVGYCGYFKLINGFTKTVYWSKEQIIAHAKKYSKAYSGGGKTPWKEADQFDSMALKTVVKLMLSKWGIMSVEMQKAFQSDQAVVIDAEKDQYDYPDNPTEDQEAQIVDEKPLISPEEFEQVKNGVVFQTMTIDQAKEKYELSDAQIEELESIKPKK